MAQAPWCNGRSWYGRGCSGRCAAGPERARGRLGEAEPLVAAMGARGTRIFRGQVTTTTAISTKWPGLSNSACQTHFRQCRIDNLAISDSWKAHGGPWHYTPVATASGATSAGPSGVTVDGGRTPAAAKA